MGCSYQPRTDEGEVEVPVVSAEGFGGHPAGSCSCQNTVEPVIFLPDSPEGASYYLQDQGDCGQEKSDCEILPAQSLAEGGRPLEHHLEGSDEL